MNHGIIIKMPNSENQNHVASNSISKCYARNKKQLVAVDNSASTTDSTNFKMCLREPKIVLDKNVVAQYFKTKRNTNKSSTSYYNETKLEAENQILVTSETCADDIRNKLSVKKVLPNKSVLVEEKEMILKGPIYSLNNNLFHNINEYITQQSVKISSSQTYSNSQILDNHVYKVQPCDRNESEDDYNFVNNKNTMFIKGELVDMECGDDILFSSDNNYYNENVVTAKTEPVEMECGDNILFTHGHNYYDEDAVSTLSESPEMECGDDILFANGAGYYSNSDEDSAERNQDFSYSYEDAKTNVLNDEIKPKIEIKESKSPILDTFEEQEEDKFYHEKECDHKTFIKQEIHSHVTSENSNFSDENGPAICEKCGNMFENSLLLKEHQFECGLKYYYTCKFCPSTSWYSSTLKNHIEVVHSRELDKENIDDIMQIIKRSKQLENDQLNELNFQKQVLLIKTRQKTTETSAKFRVQKKKKKIYINYNEIKRILNIICLECNKDPKYVRGRTDQYCSQCHNEYTFQCRKCSRFYFNYKLAVLHAKVNCKKQISKKTLTNSNQFTKVQEKSPNTLPNKRGMRKFFTTFCATCNESLEQNVCNTKTACRKCNKTSIQYRCETCKQIFEVETKAKHHSQTCHRQWREFLIKSSLSTIALLDHNYYCKNKSEPRVKKIAKQIEQPQFTELSLSQHNPDKKVYTGKKSQSYIQS